MYMWFRLRHMKNWVNPNSRERQAERIDNHSFKKEQNPEDTELRTLKTRLIQVGVGAVF